jgi:hypothetical protein
MDAETQNLRLPRTGHLQIDIHLSADVNVTAVMARRKVNAFLATHVGNLLLADEPVLTITACIVWRVPVDLTSPARGRIGRVGEIDVAIESGELLLSDEQILLIETNARRLAASFAL